ncbi:nuclear transport factor 2 family protein [Sphingomonas sp. WKB10]|nr:nuclear transport factor 2 family protein [Sphingomonas sp. WKB10]
MGNGDAGSGDARGPSPDAAAIERLVERFNTARTDFDAAALADTLAPEYQEISPVGDVDDRAKVLGFYRPEDRRPAPPMQSSERQIVVRGATGIETERRTITMTRPDGTTVTRSIRVRYVAMRAPNGWKLVSAQYTPIPPAK